MYLPAVVVTNTYKIMLALALLLLLLYCCAMCMCVCYQCRTSARTLARILATVCLGSTNKKFYFHF